MWAFRTKYYFANQSPTISIIATCGNNEFVWGTAVPSSRANGQLQMTSFRRFFGGYGCYGQGSEFKNKRTMRVALRLSDQRYQSRAITTWTSLPNSQSWHAFHPITILYIQIHYQAYHHHHTFPHLQDVRGMNEETKTVAPSIESTNLTNPSTLNITSRKWKVEM